MMQLSVRTYLVLLCGISALLCMGSMSASIPETGTVASTAEANETSDQLFSTHVAQIEEQPTTRTLPQEGTGVTARAEDVTTLSPKAAPEVTTTRHAVEESATGMVDKSTAAAAASSAGPRPLHTSTAEPRATSKVVQSSPSVTVTETTKPVAATNGTVSSDSSAATSATTSAATSSSAAIPEATSATTSAATSSSTETSAATSSSATTSKATSETTPEATSATTSAGPLPTETSSLPSRPTTEAEVTSNFSSTTSPTSSTPAPDFTQNLSSSPSASTATTTTASPVTVTRTTTSSTELPATSQPVSATRTHNPTSEFTDIDGSTSAAEPSTVSLSTASNSTSPTGIFIPIKPKRRPIPTTTTPNPAATTVPQEVPRTTPGTTVVQTCSSRSFAKTCLIAIASLAGLATIFLMSTIILCTKLSARKYKVRRPEQATEMMCISALLPEPSYSYTRQRNPVSNGVLVMHRAGDSDEEGGDNLTLSSFLPENDRYV